GEGTGVGVHSHLPPSSYAFKTRAASSAK
ncbi:MAG: hypothetical protein JWQ89_1950, partial [Devosia sp.]|nr:hypothetical protein [Devosia sp.]